MYWYPNGMEKEGSVHEYPGTCEHLLCVPEGMWAEFLSGC